MLIKRIAVIALLLFAFVLPNVGYASDKLDIASELARPGVKLVVVEFYATWCKPCMEAVPKWKKLHEKYESKGLRFIVVSVGDDGQCSNPGWSPDRNICDIDGTIQAEFGVADLPQAFLYSWQGDLLAERAHAAQVEDAIKRFFRKTQLRLYVDEIDVIGDKYAVGSNPAWLKKHIVSQIRKLSKFDVLKYRNVPNYIASDHCSTGFPANSNLRIQVQGDDKGNRTLTLEIEKDGCVLASSQQPYSGKGFKEDRKSLKRAAKDAVKELLAAVIHIKKPTPPQVYQRAGFGEGLSDLADLRGDSGRLGGMSRMNIPRGSMDDFDTNYMDLIVTAGETDKAKKKTVKEKISAWQKVAAYTDKTFAREKAKSRIKEWRAWRASRVKKAIALKKAYAQYKEDKDKLSKILSYPESYVSKAQKQAYENEFNRAYRGIKAELEQIAKGKHELMTLINDDNLGVGEISTGSYGIEFVSIPAGSYQMGSNNGASDEKPVHSVTVSSFYMMKTEVTQGMYKKVMGKNPSRFTSCGNDCPVEKVSWHAAKAFCEKVGGRLPTEAEWEYAARAGTTGKYSGDLDSIAWYSSNSGSKTHSVGKKQPNAFGLYDMLGNAWEWGNDCYSKNYAKSPDCSYRVLRGGGWNNNARNLRASNRGGGTPDSTNNNIGFRCTQD